MEAVGVDSETTKNETPGAPQAEFPNHFNSSETNVELLESLAAEYASFADVGCSREMEQFTEIVDELLTKLDEFMGFADMVRSDVNMALGSTLVAVHDRTEAMRRHFARVDQLEAFVGVVKANLGELEGRVERAEEELGTLNPLQRALKSITIPTLFGPKPPPARPQRAGVEPARYQAPRLFNTADYFRRTDPTGSETAPSTTGPVVSGTVLSSAVTTCSPAVFSTASPSWTAPSMELALPSHPSGGPLPLSGGPLPSSGDQHLFPSFKHSLPSDTIGRGTNKADVVRSTVDSTPSVTERETKLADGALSPTDFSPVNDSSSVVDSTQVAHSIPVGDSTSISSMSS